MARVWTLEVARDLIRRWSHERIEAAVDREGLTARLEELERFILDQQPASIGEAERLLDLIGLVDSRNLPDVGRLCRLSGVGRNDVGRPPSRVEHSFAPRAHGPIVGRA